MLGLQEVTAPVISDVDRLEDNLDFMYAREESESASGAAGGGTAAREAEDSDNQCVACLSEVKALEMRPIEINGLRKFIHTDHTMPIILRQQHFLAMTFIDDHEDSLL